MMSVPDRETPPTAPPGANSPGAETISAPAATALALATCLWPFLSYLGNNIRLGLTPGEVLVIGAELFGVVLVAGILASRAWSGAGYGRLVCVGAVGAALLFGYDMVREIMASVALGHIRYAMPVWSVVFVCVVLATWKLLARRTGYVILSAVIAGLLVVPIGQIGRFYLDPSIGGQVGADNLMGDSEARSASATAAQRPDVYFFILDAYSRDDKLREQFGFDNTPFLKALESRGFYVARESRVNYLQTVLSLSSTLAMTYHYTEGSFELSGLQRVLHGANPTVRRFRGLGYTFVYAVPNFWHGSHCTGIEDVCIDPSINLGEYHRQLFQLTPFGHLAMFLVPDHVNELFNSNGDVTFETVRATLAKLPPIPRFVFGHMMFPHAPYRFESDCRYRRGAAPDVDTGYLDNLRCTNKQILKFVDWIVAKKPNTIIVLQSDHGLKFGEFNNAVDDDMLPVDISWNAFDGRAGILNAMRLPSACRQYVRPDITAVNTFRLVFSCLDGTQPEFVADRFFLSNYNSMKVKPYNGPGEAKP